eukprot:TRINITY_DN35285_c0_g1_i2.p1 TRINITY_DN35285_c0_g1~~TRINITY_DN35285_c0_g1_i2.p1  ORF type:complete len:512 (+),score=110.68 TRINITY_DN35285_c0_g1_i2:112-1536(+)
MGPADGAGPPRGSAGEHGGLLAGDAEAPSYGAADEGEGEPTLREPRSRGAAIITAGLLGSVLSVGLLQAAGAHGARGAARAGENTSAAEPLPPSVVLMHEEPHTLPEYLTDPYALCRDFKHATQPVYIGMFQSGLVSLAMTVFAMMPEPVGGGDPYHPGTLGFIFAGWNIFSGLKVTVELLVLSQLPLELPAFQRYEMHCWLAASSPKFQSMMTIFMHKWLCVHWTILNPNPATGEMVGWKRPVTVLMFVASGLGVAVVVLPLFFTHMLPQMLALWPIAVVMNLAAVDFYKMVFAIVVSTMATAAILIGPAAGVMMFIAKFWHKPKFGTSMDHGIKLFTSKASAVLAFLIVVATQDLTAGSIMVYHGAAGPAAAQLAVFGARQTCPWMECAVQQLKGGTAWQKVNHWVELSPVLNAAASTVPVTCYGPDGAVTHSPNVLVFAIVSAIVFLVTVWGLVETLCPASGLCRRWRGQR